MTKSIGEKIKGLRELAQLSINQLAETAAIAPDEMQMIEQDEAMPPVSVLIKISKALGVRLGTMLDGDECCTPVVVSHNDPSDAGDFKMSVNLLNKPHLNYHLLARGKSDRNMEPSIINVEYVDPAAAIFAPHEGEEFIYVLEGEVVIGYGNEQYHLQKGESIYYDSVVPHYLSAAHEQSEARILAVAYMPAN